MRYLSVCSGIEAATVAWHPLGWSAAAFSEIEPFPRAVLAHHYPTVPCHGDFTTIGADDYGAIDLLVGGTPCQSFSIAGLRGGMADERGNLALEYLRLADRKRPRWLVWENVPGVLSSNGGRDFGTFLGALGELGYGFAYRVLDAQFFGVAQRRRRVFVVGYLGDCRRAAAVLFERHSLSGHPAPRRQAGKAAPTIPSRSSAGGGLGTDFDCDGGLIETFDRQPSGEYGTSPVASTISRRDYKGASDLIAHSLRGEGFDASEDGTGRGTPLVPVSFGWQNSSHQGDGVAQDFVPTLDKSKTPAVAYAVQERAVSDNPNAGPDGAGWRDDGAAYTLEARSVPQSVAWSIMPQNSGKDFKARQVDVAQPLMAGGPVSGNQGGDVVQDTVAMFDDPRRFNGPHGGFEHGDVHPTLESTNPKQFANIGSAVRRLTPRECERLQGFPDDYSLVPYRGKPAADGPRYKALGNSMAVPVMAWIGRRIELVEQTMALREAA